MIGVQSFRTAPALETLYFEGPELIQGRLYFSASERFLVSFSDNAVFVWNIQDRRLIHSHFDVLAIQMPTDREGVYVLTESAIEFLRFDREICEAQTIAPISIARIRSETACALHVSEELIAASSRKQIAVMATSHPDRQEWVTLPAMFNECSTRFFSTRRIDDQALVELIDVEWADRTIIGRYYGVSLPSTRIVQIPFECNQRDFVIQDDFRSFLVVLSRQYGRVLVMLPSAERPAETMQLGLSVEQSDLYLSRSGYVIGEQTQTDLTVWKLGAEHCKLRIEKDNCSVRLADDGRVCALMYYDLRESIAKHNVIGFVDLVTGNVIGQAKDHMHGFFSPSAFSPLGTYFASLIIDNTSIGHPSKLPSGMIVLTRLKKPVSSS